MFKFVLIVDFGSSQFLKVASYIVFMIIFVLLFDHVSCITEFRMNKRILFWLL